MIRKSIGVKILAVVLSCSLIAGCGKANEPAAASKSGVEVSSEQVQASSEETGSEAVSEESSEAQSSEAESSAEESSAAESSAEESSAAESSAEESSAAESTQESVEETGAGEENNGGSELKAPEAGADMQAHYKDFLQNYKFDKKKLSAKIDYSEEDMNISMDVAFGYANGDGFVTFGFSGGPKNISNLMTIYFMKDGYSYLDATVAGQNMSVKAKADQDDVKNDMLFDSETVGLGSDVADHFKYDHEETVDGVVYDVLKVTVKDDDDDEAQDAYYYINRQAQELEMIKMQAEGQDVTFKMENINSVDLPAGLTSAEESDSEQFAQQVMTVILTMVFSMMDLGEED